MHRSNTVGWDEVRGELNFIADDPAPLILVPPALLSEAFQQRDGTWLLRGFFDPEYTRLCEFTVLTPVLQLARSLVPAASGPAATPQEALTDASEAQETLQGWVPAPPAPASPQSSPVSFYTPKPSSVPEITLTEEIIPMDPPPEAVTPPEEVDTGGYLSAEDWLVTYVMSDPTVADESRERTLRVRAASDAEALRALHAEMGKLPGEVSYRVVAIAPATRVELAA